MSIALSARLQPSRTALQLHGAACLLVLLVAGLLGLDVLSLPRLLQQPFVRLGLAALCAMLAGWHWWHNWRTRKIYHIEIDADGAIALGVAALRQPVPVGVMQGAKLLPASTIWPRFLLLRLQTADGKVHQLPLFADSTSADSFRRLAVALRWLQQHRTR